jgi:hypothetical protein
MLCDSAFFAENLAPARVGAFCIFADVFEGVLEKVGGWTWFFGGFVVVECVVNRGGKLLLVGG